MLHFKSDKEIVVKTNLSNFVSAGVRFQHENQRFLYSVSFFSKKHYPSEYNYEFYDKELLKIIQCFKEWCPNLESANEVIKIIT